MQLDKLFGSKVKVDILKYLLFKRQGVSMRALESELHRTFPAIKKQIDVLKKANIIDITVSGNRRSIVIKETCITPIKSVFIFNIQQALRNMFCRYHTMIDKRYLGKFFGNPIDMDLIILYKNVEKQELEALKKDIGELFKQYFTDTLSIVFMSVQERDQRYRLADKFVLNVMKHNISPCCLT